MILKLTHHHDQADGFVRDQHPRVILKLVVEAQSLRAILYFAHHHPPRSNMLTSWRCRRLDSCSQRVFKNIHTSCRGGRSLRFSKTVLTLVQGCQSTRPSRLQALSQKVRCFGLFCSSTQRVVHLHMAPHTLATEVELWFTPVKAGN